MDYFNEAFGDFHPDRDKDAAVKFSLCVLALENRMPELLRLIEGGTNFGGVEGDPGWMIERREVGDTIGYEGWPDDGQFRAYVDPDGYSLSYPEFFMDQRKFFQYVGALVGVYGRRHPESSEVIRRIEEVIAAGI